MMRQVQTTQDPDERARYLDALALGLDALQANRTPLDVTDLEVRPILAAADAFVQRHDTYRGWVSGAGREDDLVSSGLRGRTYLALLELQDTLDAGLPSTLLTGPADRVDGLGHLLHGVGRLLDAVEGPPFAVRFDPSGVEAVRLGAGFMRALPGAPKTTDGDGQAPPLTGDDAKVLETLKSRYPRTMLQCDLEQTTDISRRSIGRRLKLLRHWGLVDRPRGERQGHAITLLGLALLKPHDGVDGVH
jgi:hypothetical protein